MSETFSAMGKAEQLMKKHRHLISIQIQLYIKHQIFKLKYLNLLINH